MKPILIFIFVRLLQSLEDSIVDITSAAIPHLGMCRSITIHNALLPMCQSRIELPINVYFVIAYCLVFGFGWPVSKLIGNMYSYISNTDVVIIPLMAI